MKIKSANWLKIARYDLRAAELAFGVGLHLTCVEKCHSSLEKLLNGLFMLTRYPDHIELMEDMLKTSNELKELTDKVINLVTKEFQVDEIILFGSYAKGTATDLSDVDVLVISPQFKEGVAILENVFTIKEKTGLREPYLQLFAFPSKIYYNEELFIDPDFIREIKRTGKVLYSSL